LFRSGGATPVSSAPRRGPAPGAGASGTRYLWVVGAAALVLVVVLVVSTLQHGTGRGARGIAVGGRMPPFAVPLALSALDGDANLARRAGEGEAGDRPACEVRRPDVLNGCALGVRGPVVLAFFATRGKQCIQQLDVMERVRASMPGVQFAAIAIRGDRDDVRSLIRRHRWGFAVGYDRDGALANAYHVQVCPQLTFARRGGWVAETTFGELAAATLAAKARRLAPG
ncbi:MAG: hypothetical protein JWQ20_2694, partial [Conexibacter sp.]|nr:hypothetical protein [Conexibacter sp.]